jgi:hypothetical protein
MPRRAENIWLHESLKREARQQEYRAAAIPLLRKPLVDSFILLKLYGYYPQRD